MNLEQVKRRLLENEEARRAYEQPPLPIVIARMVLQRRRELNISQQELAERLQTSQTHIWRIESAEANITLKTLQKLEQVLQFRLSVMPSDIPPRPDVRERIRARVRQFGSGRRNRRPTTLSLRQNIVSSRLSVSGGPDVGATATPTHNEVLLERGADML